MLVQKFISCLDGRGARRRGWWHLVLTVDALLRSIRHATSIAALQFQSSGVIARSARLASWLRQRSTPSP